MRLLLVDDDENFCWAMSRAFQTRGYEVRAAHSHIEANAVIQDWLPECAVIDLRLHGSSGLGLISKLKAANATMRIVVLTGYASIATAVEAIKLGATNYLPKPVDACDVERALFQHEGSELEPPSEHPLSVHRLEWEHIQQVLADYHGNISAAARALGMHRRTLQRKLNKHPARR
jgi:two-component system response regulator RegA